MGAATHTRKLTSVSLRASSDEAMKIHSFQHLSHYEIQIEVIL